MWNLNRRAFTLLELLLALGVLAVLSVGILTYIGTGPNIRSRDVKRMADLEKIQSALEAFKADNKGVYPPCTGGAATCSIDDIVGLDTYVNLTSVVDPSANRFYEYRPTDNTWHTCDNAALRCVTYAVCAALEDPNAILPGGPPACGSCSGTFACNYRVSPAT